MVDFLKNDWFVKNISLYLFDNIQCTQKGFKPLAFIHILLRYSLNLELITY
jgi:hypothetical protein